MLPLNHVDDGGGDDHGDDVVVLALRNRKAVEE